MRVHHLNCISTCPLGGHLMDDGPETILQRGHLTSHVLLIESENGLVLVDTGFGMKDVADPHSRNSAFFLGLLKPEFREEMTAYRQIQNLGFNPNDVRHIVLTHLDFDHAGGLDDFPRARVHMLRSERDEAMKQSTWMDRQRFRPQQWNTRDNWTVYDPSEGESWFGFSKVRELEGVSSDIALIPLIGHTYGHAGVAVRRDDKWLLNAGDAYFWHEEMDHEHPRCTPGLKAYQLMLDKDRGSRIWNQERLRELRHGHGHEVEIFCAHDPNEFARVAGRSPFIPADRMVTRSSPFTEAPIAPSP